MHRSSQIMVRRNAVRAAALELLEKRQLLSTVTVIANTADQGIYSDGTQPWVGQTTIRWGDNGTNTTEEAAVFPFQLPTLPAGAVITSASLTLNLQTAFNGSTITGTDDLYGRAFRSTPTVTAADYFEGAYGASSDTALQQDFATNTTPAGAVSTSSAGNTALANYLSAQYAAGGAGNYAFLRLNAESDQLVARYWSWYSADAASGLQPALTFTYSTTPAAPSNLTTTTNPGAAIGLNWTNNATNATNILVQRSTDGTTFSTIATLASTATSYLDNTALSADTTYYYRVYATNGGVNSPYTSIASDTTLPTFSYQTIWVDGAHGLDTNAGTFTAPFKTITAALNASTVKGHPAGTGIVVRAGTYTENNKSLALPSGSSGSPFTLIGEPNERVILSGFKQISNWSVYSGGIYSTTLNYNPTTLYVNNVPQAISRSPDSSWWVVPSTVTQNTDGTTTITDPTHLAGIGNVVGGYMQLYYAANNYPYSRKIISQDTTAGSITFAGLSTAVPGQYYSLTDAVSLINKPGEWASVDNGNSTYTVYYQPASVSDLSSTQAQNTANSEIDLTGAAHDVTIRNLEITGSAGYGINIQGKQGNLGGNIIVRNNVIHHNAQEGVWSRFENNITIANNTIQANLNGVGFASTSNSIITANDIGFNTTDGIDLTGDYRGPSDPGFTGSANDVISNNYIHDHMGWGHADGIQIFSWVDAATITGNVIENNYQGVMTENVDDAVTDGVADSNWSTLSNNVILDTVADTVIFGHGNSFNWNVTGNTIGNSGWNTPFSFTATGYNVSQNIILGKQNINSAAANQYVGDYNFYYSSITQYFTSTNSPTYKSYNAITNAAHTGFFDVQGQDQHSQFTAAAASGATPLPTSPLTSGPLVTTLYSTSKWQQDTLSLLYLNSVAGFSVGDYVQIDGDGVVRKVTAVDSTAGTITINVPLSVLPYSGASMVEDWGSNSNFTLNVTPTGTAATMGPTGGAVGSTLNIQNFILGDYNGDGIRDYPLLPADVKAGLPLLGNWSVPNFSVVGP